MRNMGLNHCHAIDSIRIVDVGGASAKAGDETVWKILDPLRTCVTGFTHRLRWDSHGDLGLSVVRAFMVHNRKGKHSGSAGIDVTDANRQLSGYRSN